MSQADLREDIEELRREFKSIKVELRAMQQCLSQYQPHIKKMIDADTYWAGVKREVLVHALEKTTWAVILAFSAGLLWVLVETLKNLVANGRA